MGKDPHIQKKSIAAADDLSFELRRPGPVTIEEIEGHAKEQGIPPVEVEGCCTMAPKLEDEDGGTVQIHARKANKSNAGSKHQGSTVSTKSTTKPQHHNNPTSNTNYALAISHIVQTLISSYDSNESLNFTALKAKAARKYKLPGVPRITDILAAIPVDYKPKLLPFLRQKPVRTASGVAVVAVMSKPHRCPHIAMTGGECACSSDWKTSKPV